MFELDQINLQFITDEKGDKKAVILSMEDFLELVEDLQDLAIISERRDEPTIPLKQVIAELKHDGLLSDWLSD
jgi:hypothetical protein